MDKGSYVAASGSIAQERAMEYISNNMANMNTPGFKADRAIFESYLKDNLKPGAGIGTRAEIASGYLPQSKNDSTYLVASGKFTDFSQGALRQTDSPLDIALEGDGFIALLTPDGEKYTRGGSFTVGREGYLETLDGNVVIDRQNSPIRLDEGAFHIREDGTIAGSNGEDIAQLKVVKFADNEVLKKEGNSLYLAENMENTSWSDAIVKQGFQEGSNINPVSEMAKMITALRQYSTFQKAIQSEDEMNSKLINQVAR
ncbi:MAG: flagellar basal-body rod protein FlgF [Nitrospinota bacterium]|nr:flagellar basal-body rod protein FlgF [Nitrospinota bacterium]